MLLSPMRQEIIWDGPLQTAGCYKLKADWSAHKAPHPDCSCGLYAYDSPEIWESGWRRSPIWDLVIGAVAGSGETMIHDQGFRSERMQIIGLLRPPGWFSVNQLESRYQVPLADSLAELAARAAETISLAQDRVSRSALEIRHPDPSI